MKNRDNFYINKIVKHFNEMQFELAQINDNYENFINNSVIKKAITFDILQIGELFSNLSSDSKAYFKNDDIKGLKDIRNFIAHGYVYIENIELWKCVHDELPAIIAVLKDIKEKNN